jgi:hypothetical protein
MQKCSTIFDDYVPEGRNIGRTVDKRKFDVPEGRNIGRTMDKRKIDVPEGKNPGDRHFN